jgi:PHD/YefM family antitoxin component YafN of YafNO toxin-antitoxin module
MPQIIPIKDLKNTSMISTLCNEHDEPVFVTKNGYGDMVIMSMAAYEKRLYMHDIHANLAEAEQEIAEGKTTEAHGAVQALRRKYGL